MPQPSEIEVKVERSQLGPAIPYRWFLRINGKPLAYKEGMPVFPSGYGKTPKQALKRGNHAKIMLTGKV